MSTVPFPGSVRPEVQRDVQALTQQTLETLTFAQQHGQPTPRREAVVPLTIRRISKSHHGRTLQTLGHAAEYLASNRRYLAGESEADEEAVRILMRLSSAVFREYAESVKVRYPVQDFLMGCAAWLFE
jgi:hypothetical protein